jgi:TRAP-type C4-dicarboxylate transport system substrate-binding protein
MRQGVTRCVLVAALVVAGCSCSSLSAGTKAGGADPPVTLRIGSADVPGRQSADEIETFAASVDRLSSGRLRIQPVYEKEGVSLHDWDQRVAGKVIGGSLDLGLVPARAWDTLGVTSLRALQAPYLITSVSLLGEVVSDPMTGQMLAGLPADVTGLTIMPEGLRHLFGVREPVRSPADVDGSRVRAPHSDVSYAILRALGAQPDDFPDASPARDGGTLRAAESSFAYGLTLPERTVATGDLVLYPKTNVLVANSRAFRRMSPEQRRVLREAARQAQRKVVAALRTDADYARAYCRNGGAIVLIGAAGVHQFEETAGPIYNRLNADRPTAELIERIRVLKWSAPADPSVAACDGPSPTVTPSGSTVANWRPFPQGSYRTTLDYRELLNAGIEPSIARGNAGINTMTFKTGKWTITTRSSFEESGCAGTYTVPRDHYVRMVATDNACGTPVGGLFMGARWSLVGRILRFNDTSDFLGKDPQIEELWGGRRPWSRLG